MRTTLGQRIPELFPVNDYGNIADELVMVNFPLGSKPKGYLPNYPSHYQYKERRTSANVLFMGIGMVANVACNEPSIAKPNLSHTSSYVVEDYLTNVANPLRSYMIEISALNNKVKEEKEQLSCVDTYAIRQDVISEIISFKGVGEDWDDEIIPLSEESASNAISFVQKLNSLSLDTLSYISLNSNSTVAFVWDNERGQKISLNIGSQVFSYYAILNPEEDPKFFNNVKISTESISQLDKFISCLR